MAKISILIPAYNSEKTITRCIDSIKKQTFTDWHIVLVDDGSKDATPAICDNLFSDRITVIHQINGGVSSARNTGLKYVKTPFLTFCDSDDTLQPFYLEELYASMISSNADVAITGYTRKNGGDFIYKITEDDTICGIQDAIMKKSIGTVWGKIYKTSLILDNHITFPEGMKLSEDTVFFYNYLACCNIVCLCSSVGYNYYLPEGDAKYGLSLQDELIGYIHFRLVSVLLKKRSDCNEEIQKRLDARELTFFNRCFQALLATPDRQVRLDSYHLLDWDNYVRLVPETPSLQKYLLRKKNYRAYEIVRLIISACKRLKF